MALAGLWGRKIGMTQLFCNDAQVVPVTAITLDHWIVTNILTEDKHGYARIQVACLRDRYKDVAFLPEWLKNMKKYFRYVREIKTDGAADQAIGQAISLDVFINGDKADIIGYTRGMGFAGVYRRYGFGGAAKTHGSKMGKCPGSLGFTRRSGEVSKGKKLPGHMGVERKTIQNMIVVDCDKESKTIYVKGSVPGKSGSLLFVRKRING
jgi:large subunit ribosomal protein L3